MADGVGRRVDIVGVLDVEGADTFRTECRQRKGVAGVVTSNDYHRVERFFQELDDRVLTLLGCAADRIESPEIGLRVFVAIGAGNGFPNDLSDRQRFASEHCSLVSHAYAPKIATGLEIGRDGV